MKNGKKPSSDNLLEMFMERDPAKWAAHQIAAKSHPDIKSVGQAMEMIEKVVTAAFEMKTWKQTAELTTSHRELLHWAEYQRRKFPDYTVRGLKDAIMNARKLKKEQNERIN